MWLLTSSSLYSMRFQVFGELSGGCTEYISWAKLVFRRRKSTASTALSISACQVVLPVPSIVAAFISGRYLPVEVGCICGIKIYIYIYISGRINIVTTCMDRFTSSRQSIQAAQTTRHRNQGYSTIHGSCRTCNKIGRFAENHGTALERHVCPLGFALLQ
jgi:hypothetical protein